MLDLCLHDVGSVEMIEFTLRLKKRQIVANLTAKLNNQHVKGRWTDRALGREVGGKTEMEGGRLVERRRWR